jgi:hypothetical protein
MTKKYWKIFGAGLLASVIYFWLANYIGIKYFAGIDLAELIGIRNGFLEFLVFPLPFVVYGGIIFYAYQTVLGWRFLDHPTLRTKLTAALVFGSAPFVLFVFWMILAFVFMDLQIG